MNPSLTAIEAIPGVVRLHYQAGQVLFYQNHLLPGVFVGLSGEVTLMNAHGSNVRLNAAAGAFLVPDPGQLDAPVPMTALIHSPCELMFIPRSLFSVHPELARLLETSGLARPDRHSFSTSNRERP